MSIDSGMDLEEEQFPLFGRDALHEYSRRASLLKFITECYERLGVSSDLSRFGPFGREDLLEEVEE